MESVRSKTTFEISETSPGIEPADTRSLAERHTNELLWQREAAAKFQQDDLAWLLCNCMGSSWDPRFNSHLGPQFSFLFPNCTNANFNDTIQSRLNPSKKNGISKKQKKLLKLMGHDTASNRRILDHFPNVIPMSYCGRNSNNLIWHDFFKNFKWLKFFQKLSAPKFNIGLSNLVTNEKCAD